MYISSNRFVYHFGIAWQGKFWYKNVAFNPSTGLIIDAFGELRDQLEQVKEDMEVNRKYNMFTY